MTTTSCFSPATVAKGDASQGGHAECSVAKSDDVNTSDAKEYDTKGDAKVDVKGNISIIFSERSS